MKRMGLSAVITILVGVASLAVPGWAAVGPVAMAGDDGPPTVIANAETQLFPGQSGDTADDSVIWRNPRRPEHSLVLADNKADSGGGIGVYNLRGKLIQYKPLGKIGHIALRTGVRSGGRTVTLVGANDR